MKNTFPVWVLILFLFFGCKETIVEYIPKEFTNDLLHADLVGKVIQKDSEAMVIISQVNPIDSVLISPIDGSFVLTIFEPEIMM